MLRLIVLLPLLFLFQNCMAQKKYTTSKTAKGKVQTLYQKGMRMSMNRQYEAALKDLGKVLQLDPTFIDAQIEWANIKNQFGQYAEAEQGYEKALSIDPAYLPGVLYSLGIVEYDQGKFGEAAGHFEAYLKIPGISEKRRRSSEHYLAKAQFAEKAYGNPVPYEPKNLGPNINTAEDEYLPSLTADGEKLIYTAMRGGQEDFYVSKKVNGEWQQGQPITAVNTPYNEGAQSISADGRLLVFTICNRPGGLGRCDLYFSEYKNGKWTPVENIGAPVNSPAYESLPSLSADGRTLYFTSDRRGGQGSLDIWISCRQANGRWSEPENAGPVINTAAADQAPFIHPDGQTLYFMSKGHVGLGQYDIFLSRLQADGKWGKPQNLGYPINTKNNEGAFFVSLDGQTAWFSSNMEGGFGKTDIYSFDLYEAARPLPVTYVKAIVTDANTGKRLAARVEFINLETGQVHTSAVTGSDGEFLVTLPAGKDYALNVSKENYLFYSGNFALTDSNSLKKPFLMDIALVPIPGDLTGAGEAAGSKPVVLKNVFFETGSAALKNASLVELNRLRKLLKDNPALKIQINGHTDNVGTEADNLTLSENRAKAVYDFLVENGIDADRLRYKGFGEAWPIAPNDTKAGRRQNRRTEFVIIE
ncbi:MAG: OmpA family protein [Saprospiraceae bacterium]